MAEENNITDNIYDFGEYYAQKEHIFKSDSTNDQYRQQKVVSGKYIEFGDGGGGMDNYITRPEFEEHKKYLDSKFDGVSKEIELSQNRITTMFDEKLNDSKLNSNISNLSVSVKTLEESVTKMHAKLIIVDKAYERLSSNNQENFNKFKGNIQKDIGEVKDDVVDIKEKVGNLWWQQFIVAMTILLPVLLGLWLIPS